MTTALENAFPLNSNWPAATVRSKLAEAMVAVFPTADLSGEDFSIQPYPAIAVYGPDGDLTLYAYDATDTVTADDGGVSCIVVSGRRYKRSGEVVVRDAAISATTTAQPASPSLGDTYIVPAAPSGEDWASQAHTVATFTARGWLFRQPFVGMMVYVADEDAVYHYDSNGDWIAGLPIGAIQDGSIPPRKLSNPFMILKVEDERDDPPGSPPTVGTMYQVGASPTGVWVGHDREVAEWTGSDWLFYAPEGDGDPIFRRDLNRLFFYIDGAWASGSGASYQVFDANGSWTKPVGASDDATVIVELWGGGGGGGFGGNAGGGGGGGAYTQNTFRLGDLTSSVTVLIGQGGAPGNTGTPGGNTSFGAYLFAFGGGGGNNSYIAGGGGGATSAGGTPAGGLPDIVGGRYGGDGGNAVVGGHSTWGGGGGGGGNTSGNALRGGNSIWGCGGGGGYGAGLGGTSLYGGNGGNAGQPGVVPGGGGGRGAAGANGRAVIKVIG